MKIALVVAEFNAHVTSRMERIAREYASSRGARVTHVVHVPGVFEIPLAVKRMLPGVDGVVTLGAVIQGDTHHDIVMMQAVTQRLLDLSLRYGKPVSLGISGPRMTDAQARRRASVYAKRAVDAVLKMELLPKHPKVRKRK